MTVGRPDLLVIGGGWAGASAALAASCRGLRVVLVEASPRLGGRASSFVEPEGGELLDRGQHLFLGAYRETLEILEELGTRSLVDFQTPLRVPLLTDEGRLRVLQAPAWPGPAGLGLGLLRLAESGERAGFLASLLRLGLRRAPDLALAALGRLPRSSADLSVSQWLGGQDPRLLALVWEPMILAVLNARPERARAREFLAALGLGFLRGGFSASLGRSRVPLASLLEPLPERLKSQGGEVILGRVASRLEPRPEGPGSGWRLTLAQGEVLEAPRVVPALPARRAAALLGPERSSRLGLDAEAARPESAIVSLWLWSREPLLPEPLLAFGPQGPSAPAFHWGFSQRLASGWRTCVVTSAADDQAAQGSGELEAALAAFLAARGRPWRWDRCRVVRERGATPVFTPGSPARRGQATDLPGLALAGDWTETGLPATIEGAARSGRLAFETFSF